MRKAIFLVATTAVFAVIGLLAGALETPPCVVNATGSGGLAGLLLGFYVLYLCGDPADTTVSASEKFARRQSE